MNANWTCAVDQENKAAMHLTPIYIINSYTHFSSFFVGVGKSDSVQRVQHKNESKKEIWDSKFKDFIIRDKQQEIKCVRDGLFAFGDGFLTESSRKYANTSFNDQTNSRPGFYQLDGISVSHVLCVDTVYFHYLVTHLWQEKSKIKTEMLH